MTKLASKRKLWFLISLLIIIPGLVSIVFSGLKLGIDFTGGTLWEVRFSQPTEAAAIESALLGAGVDTAIVQRSGPAADETFLIRMPEVREGSERKAELAAALQAQIGPFNELEYSTVGGAVSTQIRNRAIIAVALASVGILLYMAYAFRNTQNPLLYGACALVAMLHDVLLVLGVASILGALIGLEVDALFLTALLTVISFSVHDTIVVFDRVRENLEHRRTGQRFEEIVNLSIVQTLTRSINTQLTVLLTLLALLLFGGETIRDFILILTIGLLSGTYSSIFNAAQLLVVWENGWGNDWRRVGNRDQPKHVTA